MKLKGYVPDGAPALSYVDSPNGTILGNTKPPIGRLISVPGQPGPPGDDGEDGEVTAAAMEAAIDAASAALRGDATMLTSLGDCEDGLQELQAAMVGLSSAVNLKADDDDVVKLTTDQLVSGIKTFLSRINTKDITVTNSPGDTARVVLWNNDANQGFEFGVNTAGVWSIWDSNHGKGPLRVVPDAASGALTIGAGTNWMEQTLDMDDHPVVMVADGVNPQDVVNKRQLDSKVAAAIADLIGAAPEELDTWIELVQEIQEQQDALAGIITALAGKVDKTTTANRSYGTDSLGNPYLRAIGSASVANNSIPVRDSAGTFWVGAPTHDNHPAPKSYVDSVAGAGASAVSATVATQETTTSSSYTDLATTTDTVMFTVGARGIAQITVTAWMKGSAVDADVYASFELSGANVLAAADIRSTNVSTASGGGSQHSATFVLTGLTPGATVAKMKYKTSTGTGTFNNRTISAIVL